MAFKQSTLDRYGRVANAVNVNLVGTWEGKLQIEFECGHRKEVFPTQLMQNPKSLKCRECELEKKLANIKLNVN